MNYFTGLQNEGIFKHIFGSKDNEAIEKANLKKSAAAGQRDPDTGEKGKKKGIKKGAARGRKSGKRAADSELDKALRRDGIDPDTIREYSEIEFFPELDELN